MVELMLAVEAAESTREQNRERDREKEKLVTSRPISTAKPISTKQLSSSPVNQSTSSSSAILTSSWASFDLEDICQDKMLSIKDFNFQLFIVP